MTHVVKTCCFNKHQNSVVMTGIIYIHMTACHVSVHIYQRVFHQADFRLISYLVFLLKFVSTFQFVSKLDISNTYIM